MLLPGTKMSQSIMITPIDPRVRTNDKDCSAGDTEVKLQWLWAAPMIKKCTGFASIKEPRSHLQVVPLYGIYHWPSASRIQRRTNS